jgi:hypothetical protein
MRIEDALKIKQNSFKSDNQTYDTEAPDIIGEVKTVIRQTP